MNLDRAAFRRLIPPACALVLLSSFPMLVHGQAGADLEPGSLAHAGELSRSTLDSDSPALFQLDEERALPPRLADSMGLEEDLSSDETLPVPTSLHPQSMKGSKTGFFDFSRFEWGVFAGLVDYSPSFKGKVGWALGLDARVPVPGISWGRWALFAEAYLAYLDRNLPFFYARPKGTWYGGAGGADFTLARGEVAYLRLQGGIDYSYFNRINSVDNGFGGMVGAQLGFFWIRQNTKTSVILSPQFVSNGKDWYVLGTFGASFEF